MYFLKKKKTKQLLMSKKTHNNRMQRNLGSDGDLANEGLYKPKSADTSSLCFKTVINKLKEGIYAKKNLY